MQPGTVQSRKSTGFTVIELLVVLGMLALLVLTLLPALAKSGPNVSSFTCLNNNRQLCVAWRMYAEDNHDRLVYSSDDGTANAQNPYAWTSSHMDFNANNRANWDITLDIMKGPLWPYTGRNAAIYKCPSDKSILATTSGPRPRVRSMVMNLYLGGFAGTDGGWPFVTPYSIYLKLTDIQAGAHPHGPGIRPADLWVFMDMREDLINWGNFMVNMAGYQGNPAQYQFTSDLPGFYHNQGAGLTFADGHGEIHKWVDPRTFPALSSFGAGEPSSIPSPRNPDIAWLQDHSTRPR